MIALALLVAIAPPTPAATSTPPSAAVPSAEAEDIVVLGRKLRSLRIRLSAAKKNGVIAVRSCRVTTSANDAEIDAIGCAAPVQCSTPGFATQTQFIECIKATGREQIAALAERRSRARDPQ